MLGWEDTGTSLNIQTQAKQRHNTCTLVTGWLSHTLSNVDTTYGVPLLNTSTSSLLLSVTACSYCCSLRKEYCLLLHPNSSVCRNLATLGQMENTEIKLRTPKYGSEKKSCISVSSAFLTHDFVPVAKGWQSLVRCESQVPRPQTPASTYTVV